MDSADANHVSNIVIDIPENLKPAQWKNCCIYRVPKKLRKVNKEAYTPKLISIGPLHHKKKDLKDMEMQKKRYFIEFCSRTTRSREDLAKTLAKIIEVKEDEIRHSYAEAPRQETNEFVNMILFDSIFIIELFLRNHEKVEDDYILSKPWLSNDIQLDLILLENQLPFFILEDLYALIFNDSSSCNYHKEGQQKPAFLKLCRMYFSSFSSNHKQPPVNDVKHFTDLVRSFLIPESLKPPGKINHLYCATKLDDAGVKFKVIKDRCLLDIRFNKGKCLEHCPFLNCSWLLNCLPCLKCVPCFKYMQPFLEIPVFEVGDASECVFRNLMALEQCHYPKQAYISSYILLLDYLINTEKDVDLLVEKKAIVNRLGSDEAVAELVNKLGHQIVECKSCYFNLSEKLNGHYEDFWNRNMASLTTVYFRDIWRGTATVVGIIVLCLTFWNIFLRHYVKFK